ncbi:hypothetical protein ACFPTO_01320 [Paraburkholderia denitrificans]|uniref:GntR family transcriptional regulator n=1 Tax=Paraburkholderia denitrificans TaxID=694025 RepID=A0ABW0J351_9BURK
MSNNAPPSRYVERPTAAMRKIVLEKMSATILQAHFHPGERRVGRSLCEILGLRRILVREIQRSFEAQDRQMVSALTIASDHRGRQTVNEMFPIRSAVLADSTSCVHRAVVENSDRVTEIVRELFAERREVAL